MINEKDGMMSKKINRTVTIYPKSMQMSKLNNVIVCAILAATILSMNGAIFCGLSYASEQLQTGNRYKIIGPVYLGGIYRNLNNRQLTRKMAYGDLTAVRYSGPEVAFQCMVPEGTIMTIIGPAPKRLPLFFYANRYFVQLAPIDAHGELEVILELNRGIEGSLDGLNQELFSRE